MSHAPAASLPPAAKGSSVGATAKGFYFRALLSELANNGEHLESATNHRDFGDYPIEDAKALLLACAQRLYPQERRPEAMRRLGWIIYPTLLSTMVGKVIFASLGNDLRAVLRMGGRGFEVSISEGRYELVQLGERDAQVTIRDFPLYPESFLRGVFEGVLAHYGHSDGKVLVKVLSTRDVDMTLTW